MEAGLARKKFLIDEFLPVYDFVEKHETKIHASLTEVYAALNSFNFNESFVIRWLFRLRGMASKDLCRSEAMTLRDVEKFDFVRLGEKPNQEILLGLIGKFWSPTGDLQKIKPEDFARFDKSGYAKAAWNFTLAESAAKETILLTTETRVQCLDEASRRQFGFYWTFIKPFSGLIRQEMLQLVKQKAEAAL